jgi:capsular exopolysaccharide synthesis family protein
MRTLARVYEASATIEFDPDVVRPLSDKGDATARFFASFADNREYYETQYNIMTSDRVLSAVVADLGLTTSADFWGGPVSKPVPMDDTVQALRGRVRVEPIKLSRLVRIKVEDTSPAMARKLCDGVARAYVAQNLDKTVSATGDAVVWLGQQLDHYRKELETTENELHDFKRKNELPSSTLDEISKIVRQQMMHYDEALTRTRTRRQEMAARAAELNKVGDENPSTVPASELLNSGFLSGLRQQYIAAVRERRELLAEGKGENHPSVKRAQEKEELAKRDLLEEVKNIRGSVQRDLAVLERQEAGEAALYAEASKRAVDLNLKELEFHRLDRLRAQNEKVYGALLDQLKQADLARMMNVNNVRIIDPAVEPRVPIRPKATNNLAIGLVVGAILGILLVVVRDLLDNTVKSPADIEDRLQATCIGVLPLFAEGGGRAGQPRRARAGTRGGAPELVVHHQPLSSVAEAARAVRTNITFMGPDEPFRTLLVTSASPGEGKTTVACSIAISLAQAGQRVCIVDCDLRRPRLHRLFDRVGDKGLVDAMVGNARLEDVALPTMVDNLWCLPAGSLPPNPADILHSERFRKFLLSLTEKFERVVIDSPPLAAVTDAAVVSASTDGTVFVVRAFKSPRSLAQRGLRALRDVEGKLVGVVLNAVDAKQRGYYAQHYYGYYGATEYLPRSEDAPNQPSAPN